MSSHESVHATATTTLVLLLSMHRETLDQRDQWVNLVLLDCRFVLLSVYLVCFVYFVYAPDHHWHSLRAT